MIYRRHYVQYNDLILNGAEDEYSVPFRVNTQEYSFRRGGYTVRRGAYGISDVYRVSFSFTLNMKDLPCEARPFYRDFAVGQLTQSGKLWAVQGNTLIWAHADLMSYSEDPDPKKDTLEIDVEFQIDDTWHKADLQKTFLRPWSICDFMDCYDFHEVKPCVPLDGSCCDCGEPHPVGCNCCDCKGLSKDMALCYHTDEIQDFYKCDREYQIVYSCEGADRYFSDITNYQGTKICTDCGTIVGNVYSNTDIPTDAVKIFLHGSVKDPWIEINGNANQIKGSYDNLTIYPDGTLTYGCNECHEGDVGNWIVPEGMEYGWELHQGNNRVIIETHNCCGIVCAYIEAEALTI